MTADLRSDIEALEDELATIDRQLAICRQAMILSRLAIGAGAAVLLSVTLVIRVSEPLIAGLAGFTAIIGGLVWLGANKSTREDLTRERAAVEARRHQLFEAAARLSGWEAGAVTTH
jgi:hypothetical protein